MVILKLIGDEEISHRIYLQVCELLEGVMFLVVKASKPEHLEKFIKS